MPALLLLLLLAMPAALRAQEQDTLWAVVDTVIVTGNEKTRDYVILDEMTLRPGEIATPEAMEFDRSRIYSLGLFNRVEIFYERADTLGLLFVDVHERWYLIPVPLFGFRDGDPKKPYFGAGILHNNVSGRNQRLFASLVLGYNPSIDLFFSDPLIDRENALFFSAGLSYSRVRNRSEREAVLTGDFDEKHFDVNAALGKRFSLYESASFNPGYHITEIDDYAPERTVSPDGRDAYLYARLSYVYDARDIREYPSAGGFASLYLTKYGFGTSPVNFARAGADVRTYLRVPLDMTLAARLHGTVASGGVIPTYNRVYFGYGERIRGNFKEVLEGEHMVGSSVELRYPLLPARTIEIRSLPIPREFSVWRFGLGTVLFGDAGAVWFRDEPLALRSFVAGYGCGLDILLPYSTVIRLAYARNENARGEFLFDLRAAF